MLTINLGRGFFRVIEGHDFATVWSEHLESLCGSYRYDAHYEDRPPIETAYNWCQQLGWSGEQTIDKLIEGYLYNPIFKMGHFASMPLVLGFIGSRGAGKTCSAVAVAIMDYLLQGERVWSNVPISVRVVYKDAEKVFKSEPLHRLEMLDLEVGYRGGCVLVDEVNMTVAESTRHMSGANLAFSYAMQQIRKRHLNIIWTCQDWGWLDSRLRWQTDFVIACRDAYLGHSDSDGLGHRSSVRVFDLSGITGKYDFEYQVRHKYITDYEVRKGSIWLRPFWGAYDTGLLQGQDNYIDEFKDSKKRKAQIAKLEAPARVESAVDKLLSELEGVDKIYCDELWRTNGLESDRAAQTEIGMALHQRGWVKKRDHDRRRYYERSVAVN